MASSPSPAGRPLYPLVDTGRWMHQLHDQYQRILKPLSLFPTFSRLKPCLSGTSLAPPDQEELPVPLSLSALMQLIKARLEPGPQEKAHARPQHLRAFRDIILTEVKHAHKDLQHLLHDPAFSPDANRELYQHLVSYLGLVSQHLFRHYLGLVECCRLRRIFTDCGNLIRFSAQLALDCSRFLNVVVVRQRLVWEMKRLVDHPPDSLTKSSSPFGPMTTHSLGNRLGITISYFIRYIRPHTLTEKEKIAQDVKELEDLPLLDMSKINKLNLPKKSARKDDFLQNMTCVAINVPSPCSLSHKWSRPQIRRATSNLRCQSLPNMRVGKLLGDELGIRLITRRASLDLVCCTESPKGDNLKGHEALAEDLQWLVRGCTLEKRQWESEQDDLDLPPLIKALTWSKANENRQLQLERTLKSLCEEEQFERKRRSTIIAAPASHPQAATVNVRIHDKMMVKTADLQVSERHYLESMNMDRSLPIYNHLLGEISSATMKLLDADLTTGEEVKEIYKELMSTIPKEHLRFDQGPLIECPAMTLPRQSCFASSTLTKRKSEKIINEELNQILPAGPFIPEEVEEPPHTPNLSKKKLASKEYASWLKWWKATFNTDEYLKYISNNTADYLPVIFHLYNPEDDEKGKERDMQGVLTQDEVKKQQVKRKQLNAAELQSQKELFRAGLWNVNTWLMGLESFPIYDHRFDDPNVLQRRLERLWTVLHFSERERLDMAIKYSSNQYFSLLPDMLNSWEVAAQFIQDRELLLAEIEEFEQTASDPNRLFSKEPGTYAMRIQESKFRSHLVSEVEQYNFELRIILKHIKDAFNDTVTFKGRPYKDKMERDMVEMLYWLQQERRAVVLKKAVQRRSWKNLSPL